MGWCPHPAQETRAFPEELACVGEVARGQHFLLRDLWSIAGRQRAALDVVWLLKRDRRARPSPRSRRGLHCGRARSERHHPALETRRRVAVGPPPGHDPDNPDAEFASGGRWFTVETWPALTPVTFMRFLTDNSGGFLALLIFVLPLMAVLQILDTQYKVCIYRGRYRPPLVRLVGVEFFDSEAAATQRQRELLESWRPRALPRHRATSPEGCR